MDPAEIPKTLDNGYKPAKSVFGSTGAFTDPADTQAPQNKAEAQRLFDELAAEGKKVDFTYVVPQNPSSVAVAKFMLSRLKEFQNVSMRIEPLEIGRYIVKYAVQRDYPAVLTQIWAVDPEPIQRQGHGCRALQRPRHLRGPPRLEVVAPLGTARLHHRRREAVPLRVGGAPLRA
ncbi:hypothetical protein [Streptodolium elevatio]